MSFAILDIDTAKPNIIDVSVSADRTEANVGVQVNEDATVYWMLADAGQLPLPTAESLEKRDYSVYTNSNPIFGTAYTSTFTKKAEFKIAGLSAGR